MFAVFAILLEFLAHLFFSSCLLPVLIALNCEMFNYMSQLRESKGMTTIKFRPHSGEVLMEAPSTWLVIFSVD